VRDIAICEILAANSLRVDENVRLELAEIELGECRSILCFGLLKIWDYRFWVNHKKLSGGSLGFKTNAISNSSA